MGNEFKNITEDINYNATIKIINSIKNIDQKQLFLHQAAVFMAYRGAAKREVDEQSLTLCTV